MPKTTLLIVEDYEGIVTLLRSTLDDEFELVVARDAAEGLNAFREHKPHVVLLDLGLPPKSSPEEGMRFLRELKQAGGHHKTIVCTGYSERSLAVRAIGYGARDVLYKPLDLVLLKSILRRAGWIAELEMEAQQSFGASRATPDAFEPLLVDTTQIGPEILDMVQNDQSLGDTSISLKVNQQRIETDLIMKAFTLSHGNLSRAALELGISRSTLYRRIRQYGLDRASDAVRVS